MTRTLRKRARTESAFEVVADVQQLLQLDAGAYALALPSTSAVDTRDVVQNLRGIPKHLIEYIFDQQAGRKGNIYYASHIPHSPTCIGTTMPELAMVSKGWFKVISQMVADFEAANGVFCFENGSQDEISAFYAFMEQRGPRLTNMSISLSFGPLNWRNVISMWVVNLARIDALGIDWDHAFRHCPKLLRLDLGSMLLHSTQLGAALVAASTHCPHVQSLLFPEKAFRDFHRQSKVQPNFAQLTKAMERWYKGSLSRGLLQLTVPHRLSRNDTDDLNFVRYTDEYLNAITAHCPNLEYFDGARVTNGNMGCVYSKEMLFCSLEAWENFSSSCTKLRDFDWIGAPLDDRFLEVFGKYPKPRLTSMTLVCGNEDWPYEWHSGKYLDPKSFKFTARALGVMLSACPALTRMHIQISTLSRRLTEVKNSFSDDFLVALSQHCKHLTYLSVCEFPDMMDAQPIAHPARVGDVGLAALASLPQLCTIQSLDAPQASSQGVFDLLVTPPHARDRREISLRFGEPRSRDGGAFFGLLCVLLEKLVRLTVDTLHSKCNFDLALTLDYKFTVKKHDVVRKRLEACVQQFTLRFPRCTLMFSSCRYDRYHGEYFLSDGTTNVPDDLTEIYCVSINTGGAGVGNRESSIRQVRVRLLQHS